MYRRFQHDAEGAGSACLSLNASDIWNGEAPHTLETSVYGDIAYVQEELLPEITGMLFVAAHAKVGTEPIN